MLGLSLAQFCQVVLLPQGQFADFLRADAERRRTLLESLFDTGRFTTVERWLVARRQETSRALDEVDQRLAQVLARIAEAAGADLPADLDPADAAGWVAALLEQARTARAGAQTRGGRRRGPARGIGGDPGERHPGGRGAHPPDPAAGAAGRADRSGR